MRAKYRVAVIGATGRGNYGHGLDRVWKLLPQCELVAVSDADPEGREQAVSRLGVSQSFADWRVMCDQVRPDIVSICPRWLDAHHEMVVGVAERGNHIYLEKPMCLDLVAAIEEDRPPEASIYEARNTVEMIAGVFQSHRLRRPVDLPLGERTNPLLSLGA